MSRFVLSSLLVLTLVGASACKDKDPNKFETHIAAIKDTGTRARGMDGLEQLTKSVVTSPDKDARMQEFAEKVIPVFVELWDGAPEMHEKMLVILRDAAIPAGCPIWQKALVLDGSAEARKKTLLAIEGIKKSKSTACGDAVIAQLDKLLADPRFDKGQEEGKIRLELVETLGELGDKKAVASLIKAMEQTKETQPVAVHRGAATALGKIGDPAAVDALITVTFRVPDSPSTTDIGNRSKLALVSIGEAAVPQVMKMLQGKHEDVNALAAQNGVELQVVQQTAAGILGAMGAKAATEELVAFMPKEDCTDKPADEPDPATVGLRAFVANALGFIGDEAAAEPLCGCIHATHNPGDMWPIVEALGRIGGDKALECLVAVVESGEYNPEFLDNSDMRHQIRWEAARFALLAAKPDQIGRVEEAMSKQTDAKVKENLAQWKPAIDVAKECKDDKACYLKTLSSTSADWVAREKAAYELARLAKGDKKVALEMAKAFKVRSADARVSMAWLTGQVLDGAKCPECARELEKIIDGEKGTMDATMQLPVLVARTTIARVAGTATADPGAPAAPAAPVAPAGDNVAAAAEGKAAPQ